MPLNIFVADDGLDGGVGVVDQQLVDRFQWHLVLIIVVV